MADKRLWLLDKPTNKGRIMSQDLFNHHDYEAMMARAEAEDHAYYLEHSRSHGTWFWIALIIGLAAATIMVVS